jgi:Na+-translocating ferredoxin:NAD+ oxidoreductase RnfD subunit
VIRPIALRVGLRPQHYVQACAHTAIFLYWGWYWRPVYDAAFLIAGQIAFAYAFDFLLTRLRGEKVYTFGFGPLPIVLSTNLFLWFRPGWRAWQFLMIAVAFTAKAFLRWERNGRQTHIFNPSAFALTVMSIGLLITGRSDVTWGREIAITQFYPPYIYLFLFAVSLPGQIFFGVASMTVAAVATTYLLGLAYFAVTGTYFFFDSYVPIAVFLGMHLLFTDPSTSPRTELGRVIFGAMYGLSVMALYALLSAAGLPTFYDKLLQVPLMNLSVRFIDRLVQSSWLARLSPERFWRQVTGYRRNVMYACVWGAAFGLMSVAGGLGDSHPGQWLPFWQNACGQGRTRACSYARQFETTLCRAGSGWACNELGNLRSREGEAIAALASWQLGCEAGFSPACENARDGGLRTAAPMAADYPILLRGSKAPIADVSPPALYTRACELRWPDACRVVAGEPSSGMSLTRGSDRQP